MRWRGILGGMQMVAEAVTAETEVGTAPAETLAPPSETTEVTTPETAAPAAPETATPAAPETEPDPFAGIDPERLFEHPEVKARIAHETEVVRRRQERETESRVQNARTQWVQSGQALGDIKAALDEGNDQRAVAIVEAVVANRDWNAAGVIDRIGRAKLPEGKVAAQDIDRLDAALDAARRGEGTLDAYVDVLIDVRAKAYAENVLRPEYESRWAKEQAAKAAAAAKTAQVKSAEQANAGQGRPTLGVPGAGASITGITSKELEAMSTEVFRAKPLEEQARLIREARENDARLLSR